ncbi:MAG: hypothetical protein WC426_02445 [Sulfuriferula sp.]
MHTHAKRPYLAKAVQFDGSNSIEIADLSSKIRLNWVGPALLMRLGIHVRHMEVGDWAVKGENGVVKFYDDATFHVKYIKLTTPL